MTISNEVNKVSYVGDAAETDFDFTFKAFAVGDIKVYVDDVLQSSGFSTVLETPPTDGGTVTFTTAPAVDAAVTIVRELDATQEADYPTGGKFPSETHETQLDRQVMLIQQINEALGRAITAPVSSALTSLVIEAIEAGKLLQFNGTGDGIVAVDIGTILETNYEGVLSGLAEGDLLHYDAATGTFINAPPEAGGGSGDILIPIDLVEFSDNSLVSALNFQDEEAKRVLDTVVFGSGEIGLHFPTADTAYDLVIAVGVSDADTSGTKDFSAQAYTYDANGTHSTLNAAVVKTSEVLPDATTTGALITWSNFIGASDISTANTRFKFGVTVTAGTSNDHVGDLVLRWIALRLAA